MQQVKYYIFVGKFGYTISTDPVCHIRNRKNKCMGYTHDIGWPKKMNTGRVLFKPKADWYKKTRKLRKQLNN